MRPIEVNCFDEDIIKSLVSDTNDDINLFVLIIGNDALKYFVMLMTSIVEPVIRKDYLLEGWIGSISNGADPIRILFDKTLDDEVYFLNLNEYGKPIISINVPDMLLRSTHTIHMKFVGDKNEN